MSKTQYQSDRSDMVAYMAEANENNEWNRPSIRPTVSEKVGQTVFSEHELIQLYTVELGDARIEAYRIKDTHDALSIRYDERGSHYRMPYFGETCMDLRYWLLQAEILDTPVTVTSVSSTALDCVIESSPPEWESDIRRLLEKHS